MSNLKFQSIAATYQESSFTIKVFMFFAGGGGGGGVLVTYLTIF